MNMSRIMQCFMRGWQVPAVFPRYLVPIVLILISAGSGLPAQSIWVVPQPQQEEHWAGFFSLSRRPVLSCYWPEEVDTLAFLQLREAFQEWGISLRRSSLRRAVILCGWLPDAQGLEQSGWSSDSLFPGKIGQEGYHLMITPRRLFLTARSPAGLFYAVQTLRQMLRSQGPSGRLACGRITDYPAFAFRGLRYDAGDGKLPARSFLENQIRRLSELKINYLQVHIDPSAVRDQDASPSISLSEWQELSDMAARHHLRLLPAAPFLAPEAAGSPPLPHRLESAVDSLLPAFRSSYVWIDGNSRSLAFPAGEGNGRGAALGAQLQPILNVLTARGKRPLLGSDALPPVLAKPDSLPSEVIVVLRRPSAEVNFDSLLSDFRRSHKEVVVCPEISGRDRLLPDFGRVAGECRTTVASALAQGALGVIAEVRNAANPPFFAYHWYNVAFAADQSWRPRDTTQAEFDERFARGWWNDPLRLQLQLIGILEELGRLGPTFAMTDRVLYQRLLPWPGESIGLDTASWTSVALAALRAQRIIEMIDRQAEAGSPLREDLPFWEFIVGLYRTLAEDRQRLSAVVEGYARAEQQFLTAADSARSGLGRAFAECLVTTDRWQELLDRTDALWLKEYREPVREEIREVYSRALNRRQQLLARLMLTTVAEGENSPLPPLPAWRIGLDLRWLAEPCLSDWMLAGPFPADSLVKTPPFRPASGKTVLEGGFAVTYGGAEYRWERFRSPLADRVDPATHFGRTTPGTAFAYCRLISETDQQVRGEMAGGARVVVFLDGQSVYEPPPRRGGPNGGSVSLPLKAGINHLLLRIESGGAWDFSLSIPGAGLTGSPCVYRLPAP